MRGQHLALPGQSASWAQGSRHGGSVPGGGLAGQAPGFTGDSSKRSGTGSSSPATPASSGRARSGEHGVRGPLLCHSSVPRGSCSPRASPLVPKPRPCLRCPSHPVSPAGAAGRHWWPQLLLQHFCMSGQSLSPRHRSRHGHTGPGCTAGHSPGLGWSGGAERARGFGIPNQLPCPPRGCPGPSPWSTHTQCPAAASRCWLSLAAARSCWCRGSSVRLPQGPMVAGRWPMSTARRGPVAAPW